MKKLFSKLSIATCLLVLSACDDVPSTASINKGAPERLVDTSSEAVTFSLSSKNSLISLSRTITKDVPARAEINCSLSNVRCSQAKEIFESHSIPVSIRNENNRGVFGAVSDGVVLIYERTVVRDCNPRYADNTHDSSKNNHSAFGCAVVGNMVQMISDKKQITNPALLDFPDAEKGVQSYQTYLKPSAKTSGSDSGASGSSIPTSSK